jgi:hypothetical protein
MATLLHECEYDCDKDSDCVSGLLCADAHKSELRAASLDARKAYCSPNDKPGTGFTNTKRKVMEVCYDPKLVVAKPKLQECEYDCDKDSDCDTGLLCADAHKSELKAAGRDARKAYCSPNDKPGTGFTDTKRNVMEVCYDPDKV